MGRMDVKVHWSTPINDWWIRYRTKNSDFLAQDEAPDQHKMEMSPQIFSSILVFQESAPEYQVFVSA